MTHPRKYFNMVEIVLAIAVAAIGITGVVGVLPVALKSNAKANGDSVAADAVSTFFSEVLDPAVKNDWDNAFGASGLVKSSKPSVKTKRVLETFKDTNKAHTAEGNGWHEGFIIDISSKNGEYPVTLWKDSPKNNETYPVFDSLVYVWTEKVNDIVRRKADNSTELVPEDEADTLVKRVYVELTWPAAAEYNLREKRVFVKEYIKPGAL